MEHGEARCLPHDLAHAPSGPASTGRVSPGSQRAAHSLDVLAAPLKNAGTSRARGAGAHPPQSAAVAQMKPLWTAQHISPSWQAFGSWKSQSHPSPVHSEPGQASIV